MLPRRPEDVIRDLKEQVKFLRTQITYMIECEELNSVALIRMHGQEILERLQNWKS